MSADGCVLAINVGSSNTKYASFYENCLSGSSSRSNALQEEGRCDWSDKGLKPNQLNDDDQFILPSCDVTVAADAMLETIESQINFEKVEAVGHRIVHGLKNTTPQLIDEALLNCLRAGCALAPEHLPREIAMIEAISRKYRNLPQFACFDTTFHHNLPRVAKQLAIPRRYERLGIERYGFHGLSYEYLLQELETIDSSIAKSGRVILAHLGNGASMAAVVDGKCVDTSMGFTPTAGLMMGTRCGDLDPGVAFYLANIEGMTMQQYYTMVNHESGLLGVSELSSDVRVLLSQEATNAQAAEALAMFCYVAKKCIGSYAAAMGGLDAIVFSGGVGENSPVIRKRICTGLDFLGLQLDDACNADPKGLISTKSSQVRVWVIHTNEEAMIARTVYRLLKLRTAIK